MLRYVTTLSPLAYDTYGEKFVTSFCKYWPEGELYIYYEGAENVPPWKDRRIVYKNLFDFPGFTDYLNWLSGCPLFRGTVQGKYNFRYDIHKFCRKSFSILDAASTYNGQLFWVDADTQTYDYIPEQWLDQWLAGVAICYMGRKNFYPCASFMGFDCAHRAMQSFFQQLFTLYISGQVFLLPEYHDSYLMNALIQGTEIPSKNIAKHLEDDEANVGPFNVYDLVFKGKSKHFKGALKHGPRRYSQLKDIARGLKPAVFLELGTWKGDRAIDVHEVSPKTIYLGVDLFEMATEETDKKENNVKAHFRAVEVGNRLTEAGVTATLYAGDSREVMPVLLQEMGVDSIDFIFIDGGHSHETIENDFNAATKLIKPGGIVLMDDYYTGVSPEYLNTWGCNKIVEKYVHQVLPTTDPLTGGGTVQMVMLKADDIKLVSANG